MPETVVIRSAGPGEAAVLLAVLRRAFGEYRGALVPESSVFAETPDLIAEKLAGGGGFLALDGKKPVGCLIAEARAGRGYPIGYLGRLAVDRAHRRQGLAWRLMLEGERFARDRGLKVAEVQVRIALTGNIALFQALGYRETDRRAHPGFAQPTYLVMEKSLE
jgi:ribosomal protein S18 acetylase RimI-like enzyme